MSIVRSAFFIYFNFFIRLHYILTKYALYVRPVLSVHPRFACTAHYRFINFYVIILLAIDCQFVSILCGNILLTNMPMSIHLYVRTNIRVHTHNITWTSYSKPLRRPWSLATQESQQSAVSQQQCANNSFYNQFRCCCSCCVVLL